MQTNTTGGYNTAIGTGALFSNTTGSYNTAIGTSALQYNTTGNNNIAIGAQVGFAEGVRGVTTGLNNAIPVMIEVLAISA